MTRITHAVLDLAGTTANENGIVQAAVVGAVETVTENRPPADLLERFHAMRGASKVDMFLQVLGGDEALANRAHGLFEQELEARIVDGQVQPLPGARDTFIALRERGIRTALTTGFSPLIRDALIVALDWEGLIDLTLSPQDAGRGRPYPDLIWAAALQLGAEDCRAIAVVGDTSNDLLAGHRAGAGIIAGVLTGAHGRDRLEAAPHTHILDSVADFAELV